MRMEALDDEIQPLQQITVLEGEGAESRRGSRLRNQIANAMWEDYITNHRVHNP